MSVMQLLTISVSHSTRERSLEWMFASESLSLPLAPWINLCEYGTMKTSKFNNVYFIEM